MKPFTASPQSISVAYHDGPPQISFNGRLWNRGDAQTIGAGEWAAMQSRADFAPFQFRPTAQAAPAASTESPSPKPKKE